MKALAAALVILLIWLAWPTRPTGITLRSGDLTVTIADPHPGMTDVALALTGPRAFIQVQVVMPLMGLATPEVVATAAGAGHYTVHGLSLMAAGPWELRIRITGRETLTLPFPVTPAHRASHAN